MILHVRGHQRLTRQDFEMFFILSPYLYYKHISYLPVMVGFLVKQKKVSSSVSLLLIQKILLFPLFISFPACAVQLTEISLLSAPFNVLICHCTTSVSTRQLEGWVTKTKQCSKRTIWDIFRIYFLLCIMVQLRLLRDFSLTGYISVQKTAVLES